MDYYGRDTRFSYRYRTNHRKAYDQYLGGQLVFTKRLSDRWMLHGSFTYSDWKRYYKGEYLGVLDDLSARDEYNYGPNNEAYFDGGVVAPESGGSGSEGVFVNSRWVAKISGLYELPLGISISGVVLARDGYPIRPYNVVNLPGIGDENIYGNPGGKFGDVRLPAFWTLSFRVEKTVNISDTASVALAMDAFNVTDSAQSLKKETALTASNYRPGSAHPESQGFPVRCPVQVLSFLLFILRGTGRPTARPLLQHQRASVRHAGRATPA